MSTLASQALLALNNNSEPSGEENDNQETHVKNRGKWTPEEDKLLCEAVDFYNGRNWKKISQRAFDFSKSDVQCLHRWQKVLKPGLVKGPWTPEEDELVINMVKQYGLKKWSLIASSLNGRLGKQCRERWYNHLNPDINKGPWTKEEDALIIESHNELGNKWAKIAARLSGRTDNAIKNRWNSTLQRRLRRISEGGNFNSSIDEDTETDEDEIVQKQKNKECNNNNNIRKKASKTSKKTTIVKSKSPIERRKRSKRFENPPISVSPAFIDSLQDVVDHALSEEQNNNIIVQQKSRILQVPTMSNAGSFGPRFKIDFARESVNNTTVSSYVAPVSPNTIPPSYFMRKSFQIPRKNSNTKTSPTPITTNTVQINDGKRTISPTWMDTHPRVLDIVAPKISISPVGGYIRSTSTPTSNSSSPSFSSYTKNPTPSQQVLNFVPIDQNKEKGSTSPVTSTTPPVIFQNALNFIPARHHVHRKNAFVEGTTSAFYGIPPPTSCISTQSN